MADFKGIFKSIEDLTKSIIELLKMFLEIVLTLVKMNDLLIFIPFIIIIFVMLKVAKSLI